MYFIKGIMIGLIFGIPVGAIGALTIRRTITHGFGAGLISGLGCSAADLCYCGISVFGLTLISDFLLKFQNIICTAGGIAVIIIGISVIRNKKYEIKEHSDKKRLISFFSSSFAIAITNPATIVTFLLAFSIFNIGNIDSLSDGISLSLGVLTGTLIWWCVLSTVFTFLRRYINEKRYRIINFCLGGFVILFGLGVIVNTLYQ